MTKEEQIEIIRREAFIKMNQLVQKLAGLMQEGKISIMEWEYLPPLIWRDFKERFNLSQEEFDKARDKAFLEELAKGESSE